MAGRKKPSKKKAAKKRAESPADEAEEMVREDPEAEVGTDVLYEDPPAKEPAPEPEPEPEPEPAKEEPPPPPAPEEASSSSDGGREVLNVQEKQIMGGVRVTKYRDGGKTVERL